MRKRLFVPILSSSFYLLSSFSVHAWEGDYIDSSGDSIATFTSLPNLFSNILTNVLSLVGIATFIMILVGGFKFLTSGGDPKATEAAKGTITSGIIGLVLVIAAWFILLAISKFTGNPDLLQFQLGNPS